MTAIVRDVVRAGRGSGLGGTVEVHVSYRRTDSWTIGSAQSPGRLSR